MKKKRRQHLRFAFITVVLSALLSPLAIEFTCFVLNRCGVKSPFSFASVPYAKGERKFEIPNSAGRLERFPDPKFNSCSRDDLDYSQREPLAYTTIDSFSIPVPNPSLHFRSVVTNKVTGLPTYDVNVSIDENSRRATPQANLQKRSQHLLVMGCSFVFGEGANDAETLPAQIAAVTPVYHVYNLGFSGYSPASLWLQSKYGSLMKNIKEPNGTGIYVFFDDHLNRVFGSMDLVGVWGEGLPYVEVDDSGNLTPSGTFVTGRARLTQFYKFLWRTETRKFFNFSYPDVGDRTHLHRFALLVEKLKEAYFERTGSKNFYVLFFPGNSWRGRDLIPEFENLGIQYLDYSDLVLQTVTKEEVYYPGDCHPTPAAYRILAKLLKDDLFH